jgi:hypothetical protein
MGTSPKQDNLGFCILHDTLAIVHDRGEYPNISTNLDYATYCE